MQLEFSSYALLALVNFFQGVITSAMPPLLEEEGGTDARKAKVEALTALGCVIRTIHLMMGVMLVFKPRYSI